MSMSNPEGEEEAESEEEPEEREEEAETEAEESEEQEAEESEAVEALERSGAVKELGADEAEFTEKHVVTGGEFEGEFQLSREATVSFLRDLADQLEAGRTVTVGNENWEIPFEYGEPIEVEIEHEEAEDEEPRELEIEIELAWASDGDGLEVR